MRKSSEPIDKIKVWKYSIQQTRKGRVTKTKGQMKNYNTMADPSWAILIIILNIRKPNTQCTNLTQIDKSKIQRCTF